MFSLERDNFYSPQSPMPLSRAVKCGIFLYNLCQKIGKALASQELECIWKDVNMSHSRNSTAQAKHTGNTHLNHKSGGV